MNNISSLVPPYLLFPFCMVLLLSITYSLVIQDLICRLDAAFFQIPQVKHVLGQTTLYFDPRKEDIHNIIFSCLHLLCHTRLEHQGDTRHPQRLRHSDAIHFGWHVCGLKHRRTCIDTERQRNKCMTWPRERFRA